MPGSGFRGHTSECAGLLGGEMRSRRRFAALYFTVGVLDVSERECELRWERRAIQLGV